MILIKINKYEEILIKSWKLLKVCAYDFFLIFLNDGSAYIWTVRVLRDRDTHISVVFTLQTYLYFRPVFTLLSGRYVCLWALEKNKTCEMSLHCYLYASNYNELRDFNFRRYAPNSPSNQLAFNLFLIFPSFYRSQHIRRSVQLHSHEIRKSKQKKRPEGDLHTSDVCHRHQ